MNDQIKKKFNYKLIINILLIIVLVIFIIQNLQNIRVQLLFFSFEMPLFFLIPVIFLIGFLTGKFFWNKK